MKNYIARKTKDACGAGFEVEPVSNYGWVQLTISGRGGAQ